MIEFIMASVLKVLYLGDYSSSSLDIDYTNEIAQFLINRTFSNLKLNLTEYPARLQSFEASTKRQI